MKRSIIFLMALIVLCALPVLASTPEQDMVLIVDEGDGDFSGLEQVSDEQLMGIVGNVVTDRDGWVPHWTTVEITGYIVEPTGEIVITITVSDYACRPNGRISKVSQSMTFSSSEAQDLDDYIKTLVA